MIIAVCGANEPSDRELEMAEQVGRAIAEAGCALVCGGRGGVMAAACRGAKSAGGTTIGVLPSYDALEANEWVDHAIPTGLGHARNAIVVASGAAVIAIGGGFGTLSEIGLALKLGRHVVNLDSWHLNPERVVQLAGNESYVTATNAEQAVTMALAAIRDDLRPETRMSGHG